MQPAREPFPGGFFFAPLPTPAAILNATFYDAAAAAPAA
jgi:hypothetical protein